MIMGDNKSGGGWLKRSRDSEKKPEPEPAAEADVEPQAHKSEPPARKLLCNPYMPGKYASCASQPETVQLKPGEHTEQPHSDSILTIDDTEIDGMIFEELLMDAGYKAILSVEVKDGSQ
jgi:hypothetical protein